MKKCVFSVIIIVMMCLSLCVYAAPYSVNGGDGGNDSSLMVLTNPQYTAVTVPDTEYVVSGYCKSGATVNIYKLSPAGTYDITNYQMSVGASGLFFQKVYINPGRNSFVVRAQMADGRYQQVRFDAIYFGNNFLSYIKTL